MYGWLKLQGCLYIVSACHATKRFSHCACTRVCTYICLVCLCVCLHVYIPVSTYVHMYVCTYICMYAVFECVLTLFHRMCMDVKMILRTDIGVRTLQKAHTHTCTYVCTWSSCAICYTCVYPVLRLHGVNVHLLYMLCFTPEALLFAQGPDSVWPHWSGGGACGKILSLPHLISALLAQPHLGWCECRTWPYMYVSGSWYRCTYMIYALLTLFSCMWKLCGSGTQWNLSKMLTV